MADKAMSKMETRNENHLDYLRQAYGFLPDREFSDRVTYPVGVEDFDYSGWSTFHYSAYSNDITVLKDIIEQVGFEHMESITQHIVDGHGYSPLLCSCRGNAIETFDILVAQGADFTARDAQDLGVVEVTVQSRSVELFEHLLEHGYEFNDLQIWQSLMSMLYRRDIDEGREMRYYAMEMADEMMYKSKAYVTAFIANGGYSAILDVLGECVGLSSRRKPERSELQLKLAIQEQEVDKRHHLYKSTLQTLYGILRSLNEKEGYVLSHNYKDIILTLVQLLSKGTEEERRIAGECLQMVAQYKSWGVKALLDTHTLTSLLRSVLLDLSTSTPFHIVYTAFNTDKELLLENITKSEVEVIVSILKCEKRPEIKKFFIDLITEYFRKDEVKHHLYNDEVIETLLSGLDSPDHIYNSKTLRLLLDISNTPTGLQCIFKSTNSFLYLVNRVLFETEDRFDLCCTLLWKLIHSCKDIQSAVRVVENIGLSTVIRMLESEDDSIKCVGGECIKILLSSDKHDYHGELIRKEVHAILISLLQVNSGGHVLYSVMSALSELAVSWSSYHPVPTVQNTILQLDCLDRILQIAQTSKFACPGLQSSAFRLIASTQLGNSITEKRLVEYDVDIYHDIRQQTRHDPESEKDAITALCLFKTHDLVMEQGAYKDTIRVKFSSGNSISLFHKILDSVCKGMPDVGMIETLLDGDISEEMYRYIATLSKFRSCTKAIVSADGIPKLIEALYEGTPRVQESAASALAALTNFEVEEMLIQQQEDSDLVPLIQELSVNIPVAEEFLSLTKSNTIREHRRRQLKKTAVSRQSSRFPGLGKNVGTNTVFDKHTPLSRQASTPGGKSKERKKTPTPGDKTFQRMNTVEYRDISELGLSRPYSKVDTLPALLTAVDKEKQPSTSSHDRSLYATVNRVYKKLYLRPNTESGERKHSSLPILNQQGLARSLSFVF